MHGEQKPGLKQPFWLYGSPRESGSTHKSGEFIGQVPSAYEIQAPCTETPSRNPLFIM